MCEFKIIRKNDDSQILEDIVILSYNEENELVLRDVIGMGETIESAIIINVNTMNQKCLVLENPLVKNFVSLLFKLNENKAITSDIDQIVNQLELLKGEISK
ncbi:MAG: hypothetical protein ACXAEX_11400 [Promethearchaeota archaeon]|jgi:hypothetical protein